MGMIDQERWENVINALELCTSEIETRTQVPCEKCHYHNKEYHGVLGNGCCNMRSLQRDILALLKAQEPRVMKLVEVRDEADHMYLEKHSKTGSDLYGCAIRGDWDGYGIELLMSEYDTARERWSDYGKTWRCWTSRPTDEQREVTPWNL